MLVDFDPEPRLITTPVVFYCTRGWVSFLPFLVNRRGTRRTSATSLHLYVVLMTSISIHGKKPRQAHSLSNLPFPRAPIYSYHATQMHALYLARIISIQRVVLAIGAIVGPSLLADSATVCVTFIPFLPYNCSGNSIILAV